MANEIKITVKKIDTGEIDKVGAAGKQAGKEVSTGLEKGFKEGEQASDRARKQIGDNLDKTAKDAKDSGAKAGSGFGGSMSDAAREALSGGDPIGGLLDTLKTSGPLVGAAAAGIGMLLIDGITSAMERQEVGATLAGQLSGTADDARRFGELAGRVYADGYGESIQDAAEGIRAVIQNRLVESNSTDDAIAKMSELATTTAKVTGESANAVARAAHQMLVTGLADSAEQAFDTIVHATQKGLNASEDLLDTLTEYSTKFRDLGLQGPEALGLISQALDAGARDTDTAADALKEFAIKAIDGSATTARGFQTLGLNAEQMSLSIAHGGKFASAALETTLDRLRAIEDPILRDQAAVDLFGTKAEDLGDALYGMDLTDAAKKFGDLENATDDASAAMETNAQKSAKAWKGFGQGISNVFDNVSAALYDFGGDLAVVTGHAAKIAGTPMPVKGLEDLANLDDRLGSVTRAWIKESDAIENVTMTLEKNIAKHQEAAGIFASAEEAQIKWQQAIDDASASAKENGRTLDINTEKGRENKQSLLDLADAAYDNAEAMERQGATTQDIANFMGVARESFINTAISMGMSRDQAAQLADKLRLIPGDYTARVGMDASGFYRVGAGVQAALRELSKGVTVPVTGRVGGGLGFAHGGVMGHAAEGGPRSNQVWVGEQGPELVNLAPGSTVHSAGDSQRMAAGWSGGTHPVHIILSIDPASDAAAGVMFSKLWRDGYIKARTVDGVEVRVG